jgi:exopolysaccharide production protein ExoQ
MTISTAGTIRDDYQSWALPIAAFYCAGLVVVGGGFVLYTTTGDVRVVLETGAGSPLSQVILGAFYLISAILFLTRPNARQLLLYTWPILLLPGLAIASAMWSPDPMLTLRRAIAFLGTILFGLSFGSAYRFHDALKLLVISLAIVMGLSFILAFADPVRAIHQPDDAIQAVHAGSWRGIFAHRNTLGFWAGFSIVIIGLVGFQTIRRRWLWAVALVTALVCVVATGSSAGLTIVVLGGAYFLMLNSTLNQPASLRGALLLFWVLIVLLGILCFEDIARFALELLGRDSNLTGRTDLWSNLIDLVSSSDKPLGFGYFVGTMLLTQRLSSATQQIANVNAHNGFVEAYIYFGWTGAVVALAVVLWLVVASIHMAFVSRERAGYLGVIPAVMVFLAVAHNLVESTIVSPNNLNNVILAIVAAMMARARIAA